MTLATHSRHVSVKCRKGFQGERSKVKIVTKKITYNGDGEASRLICLSHAMIQ